MLIIISCISIIYKVIHNNVDNLRLNVFLTHNSIIKTPEVQLSVTIFAFLTLNTAT